MYAVNLSDLTKDSILTDFLIAPVVNKRNIINAEPKTFDGMAILIDCEHEQAQSIVDVVRKRYSRNIFRFYHSKTGKIWERI